MTASKQTRMARAALGWKITELAQRSSVSRITIIRLEAGNPVAKKTTDKVLAAFEAAGIQFSASGDRISVSVPK